MPAATVTTTAARAFQVPVGSWGYTMQNVSDTTLYLREGATVTTSGATMGLPLLAGERREVAFAEKSLNPLDVLAISGSGSKTLVYDFLQVQRQVSTVT